MLVGSLMLLPSVDIHCNRPVSLSSTAKSRIWTLRIWGFRGPGFRSARQVLCGDASRLFLDHFPKHLSSVLGRTELCHEVRNPAPQKPQIISNENHHLALFDPSEPRNLETPKMRCKVPQIPCWTPGK